MKYWGEEKEAMVKKADSKMEHFVRLYNPLIHKLVLDTYRLFKKELNDGTASFPEDTAAVMVQLADLPRGIGAKRPYLYIKSTALVKLKTQVAKSSFAGAKPPMKGHERMRYYLSYNYSKGAEAGGKDNSNVSVCVDDTDTLNSFFQFEYENSEAELDMMRRSSIKVFEENISDHLNMINCIAKGEQPEFYDVIKKVLKEIK